MELIEKFNKKINKNLNKILFINREKSFYFFKAAKNSVEKNDSIRGDELFLNKTKKIIVYHDDIGILEPYSRKLYLKKNDNIQDLAKLPDYISPMIKEQIRKNTYL